MSKASAPDPQVREVQSRSHPLVKDLRRLATDPAAYRKLGRIWLEGDHLVRALLARGRRPSLAVVGASAWLQPTWRELALTAPQVVVLADALLGEVSSLDTALPFGVLIDLPTVPPQPRVGVAAVVLDRLQDPGNVGTILRSAAALGVPQVVALKGSAALWSPKVLRAAMGAHFALHLVEGLAPEALEALGVPRVATSSHGSAVPLPDLVLPDPCAWVFGHEGQGVAPELMARCEWLATIPQPGGEESLNVAAAAAICLYESARQRRAAGR